MILRNGRLVTSYSQLDKFIKCPYNWELKYIDKIDIDVKSKHLEYGLAVHEVLEHVFNTIKHNQGNEMILAGLEEPKEVSLGEAKEMLINLITEKEVPFDSPEEKETWIEAGFKMLEDLMNKETEFHELMMDSEIIGVELPFELPIDIMPMEVLNPVTGEMETHDTVWVIGFIDLILRTPEGIVMIDHKSGSKKFDKAKLRADLQFPIYTKAIMHIFNELPVKAYYNFTKIHDFQQVLITEEITPEMEAVMNKRGPKEIYCMTPEGAEREIRQVFAKMAMPEHPACPTPLCYWCDYGYHLYGICTKSSQWQPKSKE